MNKETEIIVELGQEINMLKDIIKFKDNEIIKLKNDIFNIIEENEL